MRAVQDAYLTLFVGFMIVGYKDGEACLFNRKLILDGLRSFDYPKAEYLSGIHGIVFITVFLIQCGGFGTGEAGDNTVYQCGAEYIFTLEPMDEILTQVPLGSVFQDAFFQLLSVVIDQLAGKNNKAFSRFIAKGKESLVQKLGQLSGIA